MQTIETRPRPGGLHKRRGEYGAYGNLITHTLEKLAEDCENEMEGCSTCPEIEACTRWWSDKIGAKGHITSKLNRAALPHLVQGFLVIRARARWQIAMVTKRNREVYCESRR